jgi:hypothetical protein
VVQRRNVGVTVARKSGEFYSAKELAQVNIPFKNERMSLKNFKMW